MLFNHSIKCYLFDSSVAIFDEVILFIELVKLSFRLRLLLEFFLSTSFCISFVSLPLPQLLPPPFMFMASRFVDEDLELEPEPIPRSVRLPLDDIFSNELAVHQATSH